MPAYKGSKVLGSRKNVEDSVSDQIDARDDKDIDKGIRGSYVYHSGDWEIPMYPKEFGKLSKYETDAYKEAVKRQNLRGVAYNGFDADTGTGISAKDGDATRKRLIEKYKTEEKAKGGKVKKMAKGGSVSSASKRADGCASKGKTRGRFV
jgi:hypothetical protein